MAPSELRMKALASWNIKSPRHFPFLGPVGMTCSNGLGEIHDACCYIREATEEVLQHFFQVSLFSKLVILHNTLANNSNTNDDDLSLQLSPAQTTPYTSSTYCSDISHASQPDYSDPDSYQSPTHW